MGYEDFYEPTWTHITAEEHLKALIYDEAEKGLLGLSGNENGWSATPNEAKLFEIMQEAGILHPSVRLAKIDKGNLSNAWKELGFALAVVNMNPYNSRLSLQVFQVAEGFLSISCAGARMFEAGQKPWSDAPRDAITEMCMKFRIASGAPKGSAKAVLSGMLSMATQNKVTERHVPTGADTTQLIE